MDHGLVSDQSGSPYPNYLAHVRRNHDGSFVIHQLEDHLRAVADLAGMFASAFGYAEWDHLAGLWHGLEKSSIVS